MRLIVIIIIIIIILVVVEVRDIFCFSNYQTNRIVIIGLVVLLVGWFFGLFNAKENFKQFSLV